MQHLLHVKTLSEEEFATLASEMLLGIQHLHTVGLVHRDAKHAKQTGSLQPSVGSTQFRI